MARKRIVGIGKINIAMHKPHSSEKYISLLRRAYLLKRPIHINDTQTLMIGSMQVSEKESGSDIIYGQLYKFTNIDRDLPWFDANTGRAASEDDVLKIDIPDNLLPNLKQFHYVFNADIHTLWFVSKDRKNYLSPYVCRKFIERLLNDTKIKNEFPHISITTFADKEKLSAMLNINKLKTIEIELKRPNSDDGTSEEKRFMQELEKRRAKKMTVSLDADTKEGLLLDEELKSLATVASDNGRIKAVGEDYNGKHVELSTEDHPHIDMVTVDENIETLEDVVMRFSVQ
ncbi:MAG: DUF4747 family protein [Acidithiobacillus ferrivorans]